MEVNHITFLQLCFETFREDDELIVYRHQNMGPAQFPFKGGESPAKRIEEKTKVLPTSFQNDFPRSRLFTKEGRELHRNGQ